MNQASKVLLTLLFGVSCGLPLAAAQDHDWVPARTYVTYPSATDDLAPITDSSVAPPALVRRMVPETTYREERSIVRRPIWKTEDREERVIVRKPVYETSEREEKYTVRRPVYETEEREEKYTVRRPVYETSEREERVTVRRPVYETFEREEQVTVYEPLKSYRWNLDLFGQWVQTPETTSVARIETRRVPAENVRYFEEQEVRKVPVQSVRYVEEQQVRKVPV